MPTLSRMVGVRSAQLIIASLTRPAFVTPRILNQAGQVDPGLIEGGLCTCKGDPVIRDINNQCIIPYTRPPSDD